MLILAVACAAISPRAAVGDLTFGEPVSLGSVVNSPYQDGTPCISADGLSLFLSSDRPGGFGGADIWVSTRRTTNDQWGEPVNLGAKVNTAWAEGRPSISADGLTLYFTDFTSYDRVPRPGGKGGSDLWMTTRAAITAPWGESVNLGRINSSSDDRDPSISADGLSLYFQSNRPGSLGSDIWMAKRATTADAWGEPIRLGPSVNTSSYEGGPCISPDGHMLFFDSQRLTGGPYLDMFMARRTTESEPFGPAVALSSLNVVGTGQGRMSVSFDGRMLFYESLKSGQPDIWQAAIIPPKLDLNGDGKVDQADIAVLLEHSGQDYALCDIGPFTWGDGVVDWQDLMVLMQYIEGAGSAPPAGPMVSPNHCPHAFAVEVPRDAILSWTSPQIAPTHDVFFGTSLDDVNRADRNHPSGVLVSKGQTATTYDPEGLLEYGRTYYWRIDEVVVSLDSRICRGRVLQFTAQAFAYPIAKVTARASSSFPSTTGPMNTVSGSGLNADDQHGTSISTMWVSKKGQSPAWIQYEFDKVYYLHQMWVWNGNQASEPSTGLGAKEVTVEYSIDGATWTVLDGVPQFAQATGEPNYVHNTTVDFKGGAARYVKLTMKSNWGGSNQQYSLSEVRLFYLPVQASGPQPASGSTGLPLETVLNWKPGRGATSHQVCFSTDRQVVASGTALVGTVTDTHFNPGLLDLGETCYWKVNEVNEAETPAVREGDVWSFCTMEYTVVDDFEQYNDFCRRIFFRWEDGFGYSESTDCGLAGSPGNGTGSMVGNSRPPFAEQTVIHGGGQSMPLTYDNTAGPLSSEAVRTFETVQDWTAGGARSLVLFFRGEETNGVGQLYVKLNDSKVLYNGAANAMAKNRWVQWTIELASVGTDLKAVKRLCVGVSGPVAGRLYIDDIRLYREAPEVAVPVDPGTTGLVAYYAFEGNTKDSSGHGYHGTANGDPTYRDSMPGLGTAMALGGSGDHLDLPIGTLVSTLTSTTVATWANFSNTGAGWERIFDFGGPASAVGNPNNYMFLTPRQGKAGPMTFGIMTPTVAEKRFVASGTLGTGWHHLAVVIDSATMNVTLYLDGEAVVSDSTAVLAKDLGITTQNWLGRSQWVADGYYGGLLDEFRIYSRPLSGGEVRYLAGDR